MSARRPRPESSKPSAPKSTKADAPSQDPRVAKLLRAMKADARLAEVAAEYEGRSKEGTGKFGSHGLKVKGKLIALFTQGTLVVKMSKKRVAELVNDGTGKPFDPGHGRLMKEWLAVVDPKASWIALVSEAHAFVASG